MKRWLRKFFVVLGIIICLGVFVYFTRDFWRDQLRAYYLGKIEVTAEHYQDLPEDIDTVEVFTLGYNPNVDDTNGFVGDFESFSLEKFSGFDYSQNGFGRAENRFRRELEEESPNTIGRDAA